ncbi:MAG: PAS domain-containing protein, partial [Nitrospinae bacterium]|nr:PAS domain-containing protein [Nitrospinota bacterium]
MGKREDLYQSIFSSLIDGIIVVSRDLKIVRGNLAVEEMFRESHDSFEGKDLAEFFPGQPALSEKMTRAFETGSSFRDFEGLGFRKSSRVAFPVNISLSPMLDAEGRARRVTLLLKDMSLLKELEESSRQLDRMASLGVLALGMAHEIKNPLVA